VNRNSAVGGTWHNGNWNFVFIGCENAPESHCTNSGGLPATTIYETPTIAEKPYITFDGSRYWLQVPNYETNKKGTTPGYNNAKAVDFSNVYVATESDSAATINAKLDAGLHLVLSPGIYNLDDSIRVNNSHTVVLGLGFATLVSATGKPCMIVGDVDGVRVASILFQAGSDNSSSLLQWGTVFYSGDYSAPGVLTDIFARVGGTNNPNDWQART